MKALNLFPDWEFLWVIVFKNYEKWLYEKLKRKDKKDNDYLITAWDGDNFGIAGIGEKNVKFLTDLYDALLHKNVVIGIFDYSPTNPFSGVSLTILIKDKVPKEISEQIYLGDKEQFDLIQYEKKIGLTKLKEKKNKGYKKLHYFMACSPKWIDYHDKEKREEFKKKYNTKYDIRYWVNYSDDDDNYGWYTVEQIKEWLTGNKKLTEIVKK